MSTSFGPFTVDPVAFRLLHGDRLVQVQPKVLQALILLVARPGELVARSTLQAELWPDVVVTDQSLRQVVRKLREVLGDDEAAPRYVETVQGRGYRFVAAVQAERRTSVPPERDAFVGRAAALDALGQRVAAGRLVTVTGIGGVGKSRLVAHFAGSLVGDWPGGVWFAVLAEARSADDVVAGVARVLDIPLDGEPVSRLGHALAARGRCLVVLDDVEHVAGPVAAIAERWLDLAPELRIVVTSRVVLGLAGESVVEVPPLDPEEGAALFAARAPDASGSADDRRELVRLLDGLPLALELAAARTRLLTVAQIRERLSDRFALLALGGRRVDRHATLRAVLDWSWALLTEVERDAVAALTVFEGGFTAAAAEAVRGPGAVDELQALVDHSWVYRRGDRLGMLLTVQAYAAEKLDPERRAEAEVRHGRWFARLGAPEVLAELDGRSGAAALGRLRDDLDNLRAACERATARGDGAAACGAGGAVARVVGRTGQSELGWGLLDQVLALHLQSSERAEFLMLAADALRFGGRLERVAALVAEARALLAGSPAGAARVQLAEARIALQQGRTDLADSLAAEAVAAARAIGDSLLVGRAVATYGVTRDKAGHSVQARALLTEALDRLARAGDRATEGRAASSLAQVAITAGDVAEGQDLLDRAVAAARDTGDVLLEVRTITQVAFVLHNRDRWDEADASYRHALVLARSIGARWIEGLAEINLGALAVTAGRLGDARAHVDAALRIGREDQADDQQAVALRMLAVIAREEGDRAGARRLAEQAVHHARIAGDHAVLTYALEGAASCAPDPGVARAELDEALGLATARGDQRTIGRCAGRLALLHPVDPPALERAVAALLALGSGEDAALLLVARAEQLPPDDPEAVAARERARPLMRPGRAPG